MVSSKARTVEEYLAELPAERRHAVLELRQRILKRLPAGFEECMEFGMISYVVPLARYPKTYNGRPLPLASLASQKSYLSLYLLTVYGDRERERQLVEGFRSAGKRLDMGKSCVRFKSLDDLPLDVIEDLLASVSVDQFITMYEAARGKAKGSAPRRAATRSKGSVARRAAPEPSQRAAAAKPKAAAKSKVVAKRKPKARPAAPRRGAAASAR